MSTWYGRVEPRHVEGIVEQTLLRGEIIGELFRGGMNMDGEWWLDYDLSLKTRFVKQP